MKVAYVAYMDMKRAVGVAEKIGDQMASLEALGHEVRLFNVTPDATRKSVEDYAGDYVIVPHSSPHRLGVLSGLFHEVNTVNLLADHVASFSPDVVYLRYPLYRPRLGSGLSSIAPLVIEVNGNHLMELRAQGRSGLVFIETIMRGQLLRYASGIVGVSKGSIDYGQGHAKRSVLSLMLGNGIDCKRVRFLSYMPSKNVNAAYVGDKTVYAGLDRVMEPLVNCENSGLVLHLIGRHWDEDDYVEELSRQGKLVSHGYVSGRDLEEILQRMDICIGPLGIHRKGIGDATTLKVRRYLAHGIPTVIGYRDPDLEGESGYLLHLPADDSSISPNVLVEFGLWAGRSDDFRIAARTCAESRLDWKNKGIVLSSFLERVVSVGRLA